MVPPFHGHHQNRDSSSTDSAINLAESFSQLSLGSTNNASSSQRRRRGRRGQGRNRQQSSTFLNFRHLSVVPTREDLLGRQARQQSSRVPRNVVDEPYKSSHQYLSNHFLLFREDFLRPMREAVQCVLSGGDVKKARNLKTLKVYEDVVVKTMWCSKGRLSLLVNFNVEKCGPIDWDNSSRLIYGSLLCLTCDNFKTVQFATVADSTSEMLAKGVLLLNMELPDNAGTDQIDLKRWQGSSWTAVESPGYFLASRHVLANLQTLRLDKYTLSRCILRFEGGSDPPSYLTNFLMMGNELKVPNKARPQFPFVIKHSNGKLVWPHAKELGLDDAQLKAFKAGLMHELAVIQGPPGTGKTFLGLEIVKTLLLNRCWGKHSPILVICFTNHALDQFLVRMLGFTENLVRIGGRSQSEELEEYKLVHWLRRKRYPGNGKRRTRSDPLSENVKKLNGMKREVEDRIQENLLLQSIVLSGAGIMSLQRLLEGQSISWPKSEFNTMKWLSMVKGRKIDAGFVTGVLEAEKNAVRRVFGPDVESKLHQRMLEKLPGWDDVREVGRLARRNFSMMATAGNVFNEAQALLEQRMVDDWYDIDDEDDGNFNCYYEHRKAEEEQRKLLSTWFVTSVTQCHDGIRLSSEKISNLERKLDDEERAMNKAKKAARGNHAATRIYEARLEAYEQDAARMENRITELERTIVDAEKTIPTLQSALRLLRIPAEIDELPLPSCGMPKSVAELNSMSVDSRWFLYRYLVSVWLKKSRAEVEKLLPEFQKLEKKLEDLRNREAVDLLRGMDIVGMTTTGAARDIARLKALAPKIVVFEEAAEVFEAGIVTSLTETCQHLILIGDHQQLRPTPNVHDLATKNKLDVSMFERLVTNGFPHVTLRTQHRMRPDIADLIRPHIYKTLLDGPKVGKYPPVQGVACNLFFVTHNHPESKDTETRSPENVWEVDFLLSFCDYLVEIAGIKRSKITILTPYSRQVTRFGQRQRKHPLTSQVKITTVDNFQGEENEIILLSLVRSNPHNDVGFLKCTNRINVALSRAKHGLFIVGNMGALRSSGSHVWQAVHEKLELKGAIGNSLPLRPCEFHEDDVVHAGKPGDFLRIVPCQKACGVVLPCGQHLCNKKCHSEDREHQGMGFENHQEPAGLVRCSRNLHAVNFACGSKQKNQCKQPCRGQLPCGHVREDIPCYLLKPNGVDLKQFAKHGPKCSSPCGHVHKRNGQVCGRSCWHVMADAMEMGFHGEIGTAVFALIRGKVHDSLLPVSS